MKDSRRKRGVAERERSKGIIGDEVKKKSERQSEGEEVESIRKVQERV